MALDKDVHGEVRRDDALETAKTRVGRPWKSPDKIDAMTDEEYEAWDAAELAEMERRGDEIEAGLAKTYTLEEVVASMNAILNAP
jgi:hypothetical protein